MIKSLLLPFFFLFIFSLAVFSQDNTNSENNTRTGDKKDTIIEEKNEKKETVIIPEKKQEKIDTPVEKNNDKLEIKDEKKNNQGEPVTDNKISVEKEKLIKEEKKQVEIKKAKDAEIKKITKPIEKPQDKKTDDKSVNSGRLFISLYGFGGLSISSGDISGTGNQQINVGGNYGAILNVGYYLFENGGIYLGLEYAGKETVIKRTFLNKPMINTFNFQFMELFLGYRGEYKWFFFSAGFYYGFKIAPWTEIVSLDGVSTSTILTSAYSSNCHDEVGIQIAVGATFKITSFLNIDVSISYETSFVNAYDYLDKLRTNVISLNAGATFKIDLVKKKG